MEIKQQNPAKVIKERIKVVNLKSLSTRSNWIKKRDGHKTGGIVFLFLPLAHDCSFRKSMKLFSPKRKH